MKKILNTLKKVGLYIWQLPQNILGFTLSKIYGGYEVCTSNVCGDNITCKLSTKIQGGISLGDYIILNNVKHLKHELGHCRQSRILGPTYLFVIGIPSALHAGVFNSTINNKPNKRYYDFYTERWLFPASSLQGYQLPKIEAITI